MHEQKLATAPPGLADGSVAGEPAECSDVRVACLVHSVENETTRATFSETVFALVSRLVADADVEASFAIPFYLEIGRSPVSKASKGKEHRWLEVSFSARYRRCYPRTIGDQERTISIKRDGQGSAPPTASMT